MPGIRLGAGKRVPSTSEVRLKERQRFAIDSRREPPRHRPAHQIDDVNAAVALAGNEQRIAMEGRVHRLLADAKRRLMRERCVDQRCGRALQAGDEQDFAIRALARDLRGLRHASEGDCPHQIETGAVDQKQHRLLVGHRDQRLAIVYFPIALRSASLMRSCQPAPASWK